MPFCRAIGRAVLWHCYGLRIYNSWKRCARSIIPSQKRDWYIVRSWYFSAWYGSCFNIYRNRFRWTWRLFWRQIPLDHFEVIENAGVLILFSALLHRFLPTYRKIYLVISFNPDFKWQNTAPYAYRRERSTSSVCRNDPDWKRTYCLVW